MPVRCSLSAPSRSLSPPPPLAQPCADLELRFEILSFVHEKIEAPFDTRGSERTSGAWRPLFGFGGVICFCFNFRMNWTDAAVLGWEDSHGRPTSQ
jgi:hypothetical protein